MPAMEFENDDRTVPNAKPIERSQPVSRRGAHWRKFTFGKGKGLKVWQIMNPPGKNPAAN